MKKKVKVHARQECKHDETIQRFLNEIESTLKQITEHEISKRIKNFINEKFKQNPPSIILWEQIAFDFIENYPDNRSGWGTYFGPNFVLANGSEYPSIQKVTPHIISYWEKRARESKHPIFKARYSNLVWDFSEKIKGTKPHYSIAQIFIDSVIKITKKRLHRFPRDIIKKLG